jgi:phospholipid/cholesterol/gamma-HCH transport system substrate-binding protein
MLSLEAKVGAFVVAGLVLMGTAIFLLGDYTFEKRYTLYAEFHDVANLNRNSPVKLSGVEIGAVKDVQLAGGGAKCVLAIRKGVDIYKDAEFTIGSTGIIGSKYLQIDQGHPDSGVIAPETTVRGVDPISIEKALTKALNSMQSILTEINSEGPRGSLTGNLKDTVANLREMTANLNDLIETTKPRLEKAMSRTDDITAKLDSVLAKTDQMMAGLATDKGAIGALLHDEKVKQDVKETVASVKEAATTAKDVLGRINQFRVWWNYDYRYEAPIRGGYSDIGLKISPREGRYYYVGGSNLGSPVDAPKHGTDYVQKNRIDGLLGFVKGPFDLGVGAIRSAGGVRLTVTPFYQDPIGKRFSIMAQGYDFGRNRVVNSRTFDKPEYDFGILARVTNWLGIGARAEDVQIRKAYQTWINVSFEDTDVAYLFGMASFGAAGAKGRSKSK